MMRAILFAAAALALMSAPARAETGGWFGGAVDIPDRHGDAVVAAGAVTLAGRVEGDALIAAGQVRINGDVIGDARVLSGEYHQSGGISGELAIATGELDINGAIGDDLYAASEEVHLDSEARVGRNARITGHDVLIKGRIDGDLDVQGETVALDAQVGGNVKIRAKHIIIGPDTTIEGGLNWKAAEEPDIATDSIISHGVHGSIVKRWDRDGWGAWDRPWSAAPREAIFAGEAAARLMIGFSAFLIAVVFVFAAPNSTDHAAASLRKNWPWALLWGLMIAVAAPALAIVLSLTIVALPIGVLGLLSYPLVLLIGFSTGAALLGQLALARDAPNRRRRAIAAGAGAFTLTALGFLPWLGLAAVLAASLLGLGIWIVLWRAHLKAIAA